MRALLFTSFSAILLILGSCQASKFRQKAGTPADIQKLINQATEGRLRIKFRKISIRRG